MYYPIAGRPEDRPPKARAGISRRVGGVIGSASTVAAFERLDRVLRKGAVRLLGEPPRVFPQATLRFMLPSLLSGLPEETEPLIEGYIAQFAKEGLVAKVALFARSQRVYQGVLLANFGPRLEEAVDLTWKRLQASGRLDIHEISDLVPREMGMTDRAPEILFSLMVAAGSGTTDAPPGRPITSIRMPFA